MSRPALRSPRVALAYAIYMWVARLTGRMRLSRMHLAALMGRGHGRWTALNVCLNWIFYLTMLSQLGDRRLAVFRSSRKRRARSALVRVLGDRELSGPAPGDALETRQVRAALAHISPGPARFAAATARSGRSSGTARPVVPPYQVPGSCRGGGARRRALRRRAAEAWDGAANQSVRGPRLPADAIHESARARPGQSARARSGRSARARSGRSARARRAPLFRFAGRWP